MSLAARPDSTPAESARVADDVEAKAFRHMFEVAPAALRDQLGLRTESVAGATLLIAPRLPITLFNRAIGLGWSAPASLDGVRAIGERYREAGVANWWLHWNPLAAPAGFDSQLREAGYTMPGRDTWAKMLRGPEAIPRVATDLQVDLARDDEVGAVTAAIARAFEMPPFMAQWIAAMRGGPWRLYAVRDRGEAVGGGCLFLDGDRAWLGVASIAPSHRRRGGQGALMARRIADAAAAGARWIVTETGEPTGAGEKNPSLNNMVRCGFERVAARMNFQPPA